MAFHERLRIGQFGPVTLYDETVDRDEIGGLPMRGLSIDVKAPDYSRELHHVMTIREAAGLAGAIAEFLRVDAAGGFNGVRGSRGREPK